MFSCEFCEIFKNTFFYRTPLVAASVPTSGAFFHTKFKGSPELVWKITGNKKCPRLSENIKDGAPIFSKVTDFRPAEPKRVCNECFRENYTNFFTVVILQGTRSYEIFNQKLSFTKKNFELDFFFFFFEYIAANSNFVKKNEFLSHEIFHQKVSLTKNVFLN